MKDAEFCVCTLICVHTCLHELTLTNETMSWKVTGSLAIVFEKTNSFSHAMFLYRFALPMRSDRMV